MLSKYKKILQVSIPSSLYGKLEHESKYSFPHYSKSEIVTIALNRYLNDRKD